MSFVPPLQTSWTVNRCHITKEDEDRLDYKDSDDDYDEDSDDEYEMKPFTVIEINITGSVQTQAFRERKKTGWFVPVPKLSAETKAQILKYGFSQMFYELLEETVKRGHGIVIIDMSGDIVDELKKRPS